MITLRPGTAKDDGLLPLTRFWPHALGRYTYADAQSMCLYSNPEISREEAMHTANVLAAHIDEVSIIESGKIST